MSDEFDDRFLDGVFSWEGDYFRFERGDEDGVIVSENVRTGEKEHWNEEEITTENLWCVSERAVEKPEDVVADLQADAFDRPGQIPTGWYYATDVTRPLEIAENEVALTLDKEFAAEVCDILRAEVEHADEYHSTEESMDKLRDQIKTALSGAD